MNAKFSIAFAIIFAFILITPSIQNVLAEKNVMCSEDKVLVYRINSDKYACLNPSSASNWYQKGIAEPVEQIVSEQEEIISEINAEFPFESKYVEVLGSKMHYIDEGQGDPILFIHGNPTSSYLWRNVIPHVSDDARVITVDLIGMGKSDKPDIDYAYEDHYRYLDAFITELDLKNVTLVIHDWGSGLGFNYAANNENNIKGIAFMEALLMPIPDYDAMPSPEMVKTFKNFRTPGVGEEMIMNQNIFVEQLLPSMIVRELSQEEMDNYNEPYPTPESRKPVWKWPNEIPIRGEPKNVHDIVLSYSKWLHTTDTPMLMIYATPGVLGNEMAVQWAKDNIMNLETVNVGPGLHFIQEDAPDEIGEAISKWYQTLKPQILRVEEFVIPQEQVVFEDGPYQLVMVSENIYSFGNTMGSFSLVMVTDEGVIIGDPVNQNHSEVMLEAIRSVTDQPIKYLVYSHSHWDHTSGGQVFKEVGATILSHIDARDWLLENPNPSVVVADEVWEGNFNEIVLGGKTLELYHFGPSHGEGMTVFYLPEEKIVFVVDIVTPKRLPFTIMPDFSPAGWEATLIEIEKLDFDTAMFGHKRAFGPALEVTEIREYLQDLRAEIFSMMQKEGVNPFMIPSTIELPKYQNWEFYDEWLEMNTWRVFLEPHMGW